MSTVLTSSPFLYFIGPRQVEVRQEAVSQPGSGEVLVETIASGISAGTEMNVYRGLAPQWHKHQDPATRLFVEADSPDWHYPSRYGYANVGRVVAVGREVEKLAEGDVVFSYSPHGQHVVVQADQAIPLGDLVSPELGVLFANFNTAYNGVLDARPVLGANIVVMGLGAIGQLVVRLLANTGPQTLVAVDGIEGRRRLAASGGATHLLDPSSDAVAESVRDLTQGRGADVVIEVSGAAPALNEAIRTAGQNGLVVAMSWYGGTFESLNLAGEFHHNRIRVVSSQVGAVNPDLGPLWSATRRAEQVKRYLEAFDLAPLITHRFALEEAPKAYALLDENPDEAMQVVLTYGS